MADFLRLARARRTTCEFSSRKPSMRSLNSILEAGRWAPSSLNSQPWRFVVFRGKKQVQELMGAAYYGLFHDCPPVVVCIVVPREFTKYQRHRGIKKGLLGRDESILNPGMPALLMALEAESLGIGSCILTLDEKLISHTVGLRKGDRLPIAVGLGYPSGDKCPGGFTHTRKPLGSLVDFGRFSGVSDG